MKRFISRGGCMTALAVILIHTPSVFAQTYTVSDPTVLETLVVRAASEELKQALGVSNITAEDLENAPPANDLSEIIRKMPGVNLTGNSATGIRGNNRQIDIRGMGPENTLILIDGKPVLSRNSVRYGRSGERDTRGDSNWVPAGAVERIEVIRGPAAARYGSGAAGGVVNIITKKPKETTVEFSVFAQMPEHSDEGGSRRANLVIGGPVNDMFSYRILAGIAQSDPDSADVNDEAGDSADALDTPAGREGVINRDISGLWSADINADHSVDFELTYSRQSNIYAGDTQYSSGGALIEDLTESGAETNTMTRTTASVTHKGKYDFGESNSFVQWEHTHNRRLLEGLAGGGEGKINSDSDYGDIYLDNLIAKSEFDIPLDMLWNQTVTLGGEYRGEFMLDNVSIQQAMAGGAGGVAADPADRDPKSFAHLLGLYVEDNIMVNDRLTVTPGLRADYHDKFGLNFSPSLNASYQVTDEITVKGGIARAYKSPNLYQLNPNYVYTSRGNGCWQNQGQCYVLGNPDLDPEISLNKEIGVSYQNLDGLNASLTYYHNDYENRIASGKDIVDTFVSGANTYNVFRWANSGPAVISGLEGSLTVPFLDQFTWTTNASKIIETRDKSTGEPLSLVPEYTINTSLRYEPMENLGLTLGATHYGKIKPQGTNPNTGAAYSGDDLAEREAYTIVDASVDYEFNEHFKVTGGVNNVFDFRLQRTNEGAQTFNEPGRAYYVSLNGSF